MMELVCSFIFNFILFIINCQNSIITLYHVFENNIYLKAVELAWHKTFIRSTYILGISFWIKKQFFNKTSKNFDEKSSSVINDCMKTFQPWQFHNYIFLKYKSSSFKSNESWCHIFPGKSFLNDIDEKSFFVNIKIENRSYFSISNL